MTRAKGSEAGLGLEPAQEASAWAVAEGLEPGTGSAPEPAVGTPVGLRSTIKLRKREVLLVQGIRLCM